MLTQNAGSPKFCKYGNCHPPRKRVVIKADATITFAYSARKNKANFILEYSV